VVDWSAVDHAKQQEQKIVLKYVEPVKRSRGRPRKAPYGLKANGQPYVRRPRNWKEQE
jgi:DNA primase